jgi:hypothetical protein
VSLIGILSACNSTGDADETTEAPAPRATTAQADRPGPVTATASITPRVTSSDDATATPGGAATPDPTPDAFTPLQAALAQILLRPSDFAGGWTLLRQAAVTDAASSGLCGNESFAGAIEKYAEIEAEYTSEDDTTFVVERLTEYPVQTAEQALEHIRDSADCEEFTDSSGLTVKLNQATAPDVGDEAFAVHMSFEATDDGRLQGDLVYLRVGGLVASLSYLTSGAYDSSTVAELAAIAADRMSAAGGSVRFSPTEQEILDGLLVPADVGRGWSILDAAGVSDASGWRPLCGDLPFADFDELRGRVSTLIGEGRGGGDATIQQVLSAYPGSVADDALAYERESVSCDEWTSGSVTIALTPSELNGLDADLFAVHFAFVQNGSDVEGEWVVARVGDLIANIIYTDPAGFDLDEVQDVVDIAVEKMESIDLP